MTGTPFSGEDKLKCPATSLYGLLRRLNSKEFTCNPGSGGSPGEGNGNPLQCSCLENSMDRGPRWATVHGVPESDTTLWLNTTTTTKLTSILWLQYILSTGTTGLIRAAVLWLHSSLPCRRDEIHEQTGYMSRCCPQPAARLLLSVHPTVHCWNHNSSNSVFYQRPLLLPTFLF